MNNKTGFNRLGVRAGHRRAMLKNLVTSLIKHERITTTKSKALELRRKAERMITRAKVDSVHNRREVGKVITDKDMLAKLFNVLGPRFISRAGGYTRVLKIGQRFGDAAEMVIIEFVERTVKAETESTEKKEKVKAPAAKKEETQASAEKKTPEKKAPAKAAPKAEAKAVDAEKAPAKKAAPKKAKETDVDAK